MIEELREGIRGSWGHVKEEFAKIEENAQRKEDITDLISSYKTASEIFKVYLDIFDYDIDFDSRIDVVEVLESNRITYANKVSKIVENYLYFDKNEKPDNVQRAEFVLSYYDSVIENIKKKAEIEDGLKL